MKSINVSGKRKMSVARANARQGTGIVRINKVPIEIIEPSILRLKFMEPIIIAGDAAKKIDIDVLVRGGGVNSQAEASRITIAKALVDFTKSDKLRETFLAYDRNMLVADVRRKESSKPNRHGHARAKVQKSYR
ncbi:MAG: 30S ribosomal protein S9 [Nanoarchaeota archaeon]